MLNEEQLIINGWKNLSVGHLRSKNLDDNYTLIFRENKLNELQSKNVALLENATKFGVTKNAHNQRNDRNNEHLESKALMGDPEEFSTPFDFYKIFDSFKSYEILQKIRSQSRDSLVIAFDSEFWYPHEYGGEVKSVLSYQFALYDAERATIKEFVFIPKNDTKMSLELAIGCILDHLECYKPIRRSNVTKWVSLSGKKKRTVH